MGGHQHLHHQLVAGRAREVGWRAQPLGQFMLTRRRDAIVALALVRCEVVGFDQAVSFEALECRVDLSHVQGPDVAGRRLELLA